MRLVVAVCIALCAQLPGQPSEHLGKTLADWQADLAAPSNIERLLAARAIGEMAIAQQEGAEDALFDAAGHTDGSVRYWAATAAGYLPSLKPSQIESLKKVLGDEVPEVRIQAALALISAEAESEALETLAMSLSHPNRGVRLHAVHAADAIGAKAAPLVDALRDVLDDEFDYVRRVARHALWTLGARPCPYRACD